MNKTLKPFIVHEHFCLSHEDRFYQKWWLFNNEDINSHESMLFTSFVLFVV